MTKGEGGKQAASNAAEERHGGVAAGVHGYGEVDDVAWVTWLHTSERSDESLEETDVPLRDLLGNNVIDKLLRGRWGLDKTREALHLSKVLAN